MRLGLKHHRMGQLAAAEACYRRVLTTQPGHAEALHLLGLIAHQVGRHGAAVELIGRAIAQNDRNARYFSDLGAALKAHGQLDDAVAALRRAIGINPDLGDAHCNLGAVLRDQGKLDEAVTACRQAIRIWPNDAEAYFNLGILHHDCGNLDDAIVALRQAIRIKSGYAEGHFSLGRVLHIQGKLDEAVVECRRAIEARPDYAEAYCSLGALLFDQGRLDEAVAACRQAIRLRPDYPEAYCNLGLALRTQGKLDEAVAAHREAVRLKPDFVEGYTGLARALHDQNMIEEAVAACRQAIMLQPKCAEAHNNLGLALTTLGRLSEGRAALELAVELAPGNASYRRNLSELTRFAAGDQHFVALEQLARDAGSLSVANRIELHFALGKAFEDVNRHAEAFRQWLDGNALKRAQITYDEAGTLAELNRIREVFTSDLFRTWQNEGNPSAVPVFIIGMMRSGSTLVEQILASHRQVFGGGELTYFAKAMEEIRTGPGASINFPELVSGMTGPDFRDLGNRYLSKIERLAPTATHITDKMPGNFVFAGLIHLAFPNAPIIHTVRDPVDTCLSCFSKLFVAKQNHTYDLAELGRYYRQYQVLMAHWHRVLPDCRILDVRYEDLVSDLEGQARRIVAHCGIDWDPCCLDFHKTERPVRTASAIQVRQPIYRSSVDRWRFHEPFLGPLLQELGLGSDRE